jgi:hypothetical protein
VVELVLDLPLTEAQVVAVLALSTAQVGHLYTLALLLTVVLVVVVDLGRLQRAVIPMALIPLRVVVVVLGRAAVVVALAGRVVVLVHQPLVLMLVQAWLAKLVLQPVVQRLGLLLKMYLFGFWKEP